MGRDTAKQVVSRCYPPDPGAAARARELVRRACVCWDYGRFCDDAQAVVSELVTNAVRHARTPVQVTLHRGAGGFRLEVADESPAPPEPRPAEDPFAEGGRGLLLVEALSACWRVEAQPPGKRVWARFGAA